MASPTQRTLELFRSMPGWRVGIVERWLGPAQKRVDLYSFIDILAFNDEHVVGIQATTVGHVPDRLRKIREEEPARENAIAWLSHPSRRILVVGWRKYTVRVNGRNWRSQIVEVNRDMFD